MKSARWEILATTPGNVPQPKVRAKARGKAKAKAKASMVPGPKNGNGQGKERAWAGQCHGCGEDGHRVANCPKWKTLSTGQNEEAEAQEEMVQVASVYWDVGCVEVKPKHKMTNRFPALEKEDDGEMARPSRFGGNTRCRRCSEIPEGQAGGGHSGQWCRGGCVASQVVARDPHGKRRRRKKKVWCPMVRKWVIMAKRRSSLEGRRAA